MMRTVLVAILLLIVFGVLPSISTAQNHEPTSMLERVADDYLRQRLTVIPGQLSITLDKIKQNDLPACTTLTPFLPGALRPRTRMTIGIRCTAPATWTIYIQATVSLYGQYYVTARPIPAGTQLLKEDLSPRDGDLLNLPAGVLTDPLQLVGMQTKHRLSAGQTIRSSALRHPVAVQRGQNVRITASGAGFVVSSEGQAMADAAPGATVQVRMPSGQVVSGVVKSAGQVDVML